MKLFGVLLFVVLFFVMVVKVVIVIYDWMVIWVWVVLDGVGRLVVGINNVWFCLQIDVMVGDIVIINFINNFGNQISGFYFYGINQVQIFEMDGLSGVIQCLVFFGLIFQYKFVVDVGGIFWCKFGLIVM